VKLAALDLNLLVVLDALLTEHSVSRAAKRLNSTQPAVSRALGRLRVWFDDPLLTRTRHGMVPTPLAVALAGDVRAVLERIEGFVARREGFDPSTVSRTFRATMSDYPQYLLGRALLAKLAAAAPNVSVDVVPWSLEFPAGLESGALDFAISPTTTPVPGLRSRELFTDELVLMARKGHPALAQPMTLRRYAALTHVQSAPNGRQGSVVDDLLAGAGLTRHVVLRVPSNLALPGFVATSDCCATVPAGLAAAMAGSFELQVVSLPFDAPAIRFNLVWHERAHHDAGNAWLRSEMLSLFARRTPAGGGKRVGILDLSRRAKKTL
jgi:DNA-binding transcriptional LysR family regulator